MPLIKNTKKATQPYQVYLTKSLAYFFSYLLMLIFWEVVMYLQMVGSFEGFSVTTLIFTPAFAMLLTALSGWIKNETASSVVDIVIAVVVSAFYIGQSIYFQIFGSIFSVSLIGVGGDAMDDFGWTLGSVIRDAFGIILILLVPIVFWGIARVKYLKKMNFHPLFHLGAFLMCIVLWITSVLLLPLGGKEDFSAYNAYHGSLVDVDTSAMKLGVLSCSAVQVGNLVKGVFVEPSEEDPGLQGGGQIIQIETETGEKDPTVDTTPNIYPEIDFKALSEKTTDKNIKALCEYLINQNGTNRNEYTGKFAGYNLIYICAEAWSSYVVDPVLTPTMYKLANEGIVLDNFYNTFKNTTTNGEFAFMTSLYPDVSRDADCGNGNGSFTQSAKNYMPMGLGTLFKEQCGVTSRAYHNFKGYYYNRNKTHPNLGFACKFMNAGLKLSTSWPASDDEMFRQSIKDYINDDQFLAYYMTFSGHGPYGGSNAMYNRNIETVRPLTNGRNYTEKAIGYFSTNYELEKALAYLMEELEKAGKLENTVIVLTGDHYPYYLDANARNSIAGHKVDTNFEMYKSACTIWNGGMKEAVHVSDFCCNVDILPTILNLFGIKYDSRLLAGVDVFSNGPHVSILQNQSFVTEYVKYNASNGKAEWEEGVTLSDTEKDAYLKSIKDYIAGKFNFSLKLVDTDFYKFVWNNTTFNTPWKPKEN